MALANATLVHPFGGAILRVFAPLPLLWLVARGARRAAVVAAAGALAVPAAVGGPDAALAVAVPLVPLTGILAFGLVGRWSVDRTTVGAVAGTILAGGLVLAARGVAPEEAARAAAQALGEAVRSALTSGGAARPADPAVVAATFLRMLPALLVVQTAAAAWLNLLGLRRIVGAGAPPLDDWSAWRTPEPLVFVLIAGGAALLPGVPALTTVGLNLLAAVGFVYLLQGLAIIGFFFRARRVPLALRVAGYALIGPQVVLLALVGVLGLADLWIDFRRRAGGGDRTPDDAETGGTER
jgi:uncharacterized protein YybS (DUF2232 family)